MHAGPTVIIEQCFDNVSRSASPEKPVCCALIWPQQNALAVFDGGLGHGVLESPAQEHRITLLVNWWTQKPAVWLALCNMLEPDFVAFKFIHLLLISLALTCLTHISSETPKKDNQRQWCLKLGHRKKALLLAKMLVLQAVFPGPMRSLIGVSNPSSQNNLGELEFLSSNTCIIGQQCRSAVWV